jgi:beta-lactamase superfamily II metal-dependent hydrolase
MTVLDVGQGDSIFVLSPRGSTLLIDGGGAFKGFKGREEHLAPEPGEDVVSPSCGREDSRSWTRWR